MKLTSGKLLRVMAPGRAYQAAELAERFHTSTAHVNDMLCTLFEDGFVRMNSHSSRIIRFERLSFLPEPLSQTIARPETPTSVATQPMPRQLHGSLRGYDASLGSLRGLAMLTRRPTEGTADASC